MPGGAVIARLYGKLPAHGDFVSRGFTRAESETCDAWLSASLADARAAHEEAFEARYDHAPPWRYAGDGVGGALALSQDAAGRRFPIYVALATPAPVAAAAAIEELLYRAIAERWSADVLVTAAEAFNAPTADNALNDAHWWVEAETDALIGARPPELLTRMLVVKVVA